MLFLYGTVILGALSYKLLQKVLLLTEECLYTWFSWNAPLPPKKIPSYLVIKGSNAFLNPCEQLFSRSSELSGIHSNVPFPFVKKSYLQTSLDRSRVQCIKTWFFVSPLSCIICLWSWYNTTAWKSWLLGRCCCHTVCLLCLRWCWVMFWLASLKTQSQ